MAGRTERKLGRREGKEMEGRGGRKQNKRGEKIPAGHAGMTVKVSHEPKIMANPRPSYLRSKIKENLFQWVKGILDCLK